MLRNPNYRLIVRGRGKEILAAAAAITVIGVSAVTFGEVGRIAGNNLQQGSNGGVDSEVGADIGAGAGTFIGGLLGALYADSLFDGGHTSTNTEEKSLE